MTKEKVKFEDKIRELEEIISSLENGNTSLEDSIDKYTKAMLLAAQCDIELKNADEKINKIILENGEIDTFKLEE